MPKKTAAAPSARRTGDSTPAKKVTVSQATIDQIKSQGMAAAIKKVAAGGAGAAYTEGVKRMYGAARVAKATSANINAASKPKAYGAKNMPAYRPATAGTTKATPKASSKSSSNATKLFGLLGGTNMSNPKGPKTAAYAAAEAKRVAAARAAEAKRRAAAKK